MRQRELEILLEQVPPPEPTDPDTEQVPTPAPLAAWLIYQAHGFGDVEGRTVADLGCGTGILAIGAAAMGAGRVVGVDRDADALETARRTARDLDVAVDWVRADVAGWEGRVDTVLMNPPWGTRRKGADRPFLAAAVRLAEVAYSFHRAGTEGFVVSFVEDLGGEVEETWDVDFPVPHQHRYQRETEREVQAVCVRIRGRDG